MELAGSRPGASVHIFHLFYLSGTTCWGFEEPIGRPHCTQPLNLYHLWVTWAFLLVCFPYFVRTSSSSRSLSWLFLKCTEIIKLLIHYDTIMNIYSRWLNVTEMLCIWIPVGQKEIPPERDCEVNWINEIAYWLCVYFIEWMFLFTTVLLPYE